MSAAVTEILQTENATLHDFYTAILPTEGGYTLFTLPDKKHYFVENVDELVIKTLELEHDASNSAGQIYYAMAGYGAENKRTQDNVVSVKSFWADIDCGENKATEGKGYPTKKDANTALSQFIKTYALPLVSG